ncbi:hypothetical protein ASG54_17870 [Aureimonas sp. Leaf460]|nr:hypothetical protein ASG62_16595 [Aureimonas sp. Leaf427]KQT73248.1 hypothetical protein ASG54_17870 [Aureimonas sp. Leaf460]
MTAGFVNEGGVWKPIKELWVNDASVWKRVYQNVIEIMQTANEANVVLRSKVVAAGWGGVEPVKVLYTVASGVWVYSPPDGSWALNLRDFPAGSEITVINNGYIAGVAGAGGNGGSWDSPGGAGGTGGHGLLISDAGNYSQTIHNNGHIWGGGGGGGGGGGARARQDGYQSSSAMGDCFAGGGGGGGALGARGSVSQPGSAVYNYSSTTSATQVEREQRNVASGSSQTGGIGATVARYSPNQDGEQFVARAVGGTGGNGGGYGQPGQAGGAGVAQTGADPGNGFYNVIRAPQAGGAGGSAGFWGYNYGRASWPNGYGDIRGNQQA